MRRLGSALIQVSNRIQNCWVGDLIGVGGIFVLLFTWLLVTPVLK